MASQQGNHGIAAYQMFVNASVVGFVSTWVEGKTILNKMKLHFFTLIIA